MIRGRHIICVASNWDDHPTSKHHVMRRLAAANDVLWVNYHASRRPRLTRTDLRLAWRRLGHAVRPAGRVMPRLQVLSPLLIPWPASTAARAINTWLLRRHIAAALRRQPPRPIQLWLFTPDVPELIAALPAERVVYYCVDDFAGFAGFDAALIEKLEALTVAQSDLVITTSGTLFERHRPRHSRVHLVPHGVDYEHFAAAVDLPREAVPPDVRGLPRPVFGYMGMISEYVDLELLAAAARARPAWSFVLLGDARRDVGVVAGLPNVHLLGGRPYEELPAYCRGFDVGLIPFEMNRLVRAVNPIKLREYLAAGLPVVSAPMAAVRDYAPDVHTADTLPTFLSACETAWRQAAAGDRRARQERVRGESWAARVEWLSHLVEHLPPTPTEAGAEAAAAICGAGHALPSVQQGVIL